MKKKDTSRMNIQYVAQVAASLLLLAAIIHFFLIASYSIHTHAMSETFQEGDRVFVLKHFFYDSIPPRSVVLYTPSFQDEQADPLLFGRCIAGPGDSLWVSANGFRVNTHPLPFPPNSLANYTYPKAIEQMLHLKLHELNIPFRKVAKADTLSTLLLTFFERYCLQDALDPVLNANLQLLEFASYCIVVPRKQTPYPLTPELVAFCKSSILKQTAGKAEFRDGKVYVDNQLLTTFSFEEDHYWLLGDNTSIAIDSRHLGCIPQSSIDGIAFFRWWSSDANRRFKKL